jgi:hypothetical protein
MRTRAGKTASLVDLPVTRVYPCVILVACVFSDNNNATEAPQPDSCNCAASISVEVGGPP